MSTPATTDLRTQARDTWIGSGRTMSGKELADRYGMSERWGRLVIKAAKQDGAVPLHAVSASTPSASKRATTPAKPAPARRTAPVPSAIYWAAVVGVVVVAAITAAASYVHMQTLAEHNGQGVMSYALPISVDGIMLTATMAMLVRRQRGQSVRLAWTCLALGVTLSIVANVASAYQLPAWTQGAISAWPPLLLLLSIHLLIQLRKSP